MAVFHLISKVVTFVHLFAQTLEHLFARCYVQGLKPPAVSSRVPCSLNGGKVQAT